MNVQDTALWDRWRSRRDADAFAELVARHSGMVYAASKRVLGNAADAEDVAQECFIELMGSRATVRASLAPWLHTLAVRRSIDRVRSNRRRRKREELSTAGRETRDDVPVDGLLEEVDRAIERLPEKLKLAVVLRFLEGRSHDEIAATLDVSPATVRYRVHRGVDRIRDRLRRRGVRVGTAALATWLGTQAVEAAPSSLNATLGKLSLAGSASTAEGVVAGAITRIGGAGVLAMKLKTKVSIVAAALLVLAALLWFGDLWTSDAPSPPVDTRLASEVAPASAPVAERSRESVSSAVATASIVGVARDADTGTALVGVNVAAGDRQVATDENGSFALEIAPGRYLLSASKSGFRTTETELELAAGADASEEIHLERSFAVRCVDEAGSPVPDATVHVVEVSRETDRSELRSAVFGPFTTDEHGRAYAEDVLPRAPAGRSVFLAAYARFEDRLAGVGDASSEGENRMDSIEILLVEVARVEGTVEVPAGFDPRDVTVRLLSLSRKTDPRQPSFEGASFSRYGETRSVLSEQFDVQPDGNGRFVFRGLPSMSTIYLAAEGDGLGQAQFMGEEPRRLRDIVLRLDAEAVITGRFTHKETGDPVRGIGLAATPQDSVSVREEFFAEIADDGTYRITGLPPTSYSVTLPNAFAREEWTMPVYGLVQVSAGETTELNVELESGALVSGSVADASTGEPIPDVLVAVLSVANRCEHLVGRASTGDDGRYELRVPGGSLRLYLMSWPEEYDRPRDSVPLEIAADERRREGVDFRLERRTSPAISPADVPYGTARGRILGPDGAPLEDVPVMAWREWEDGETDGIRPWAWNPTTRAITDADGQYELAAVAKKNYHVAAGGGEFSTAQSARFRVAKDDAYVVEDLYLKRGTSSIAGRVLDPDGKPLGAAAIVASSENKSSRGMNETLTDGEGRFRIEHLLSDEPVDLLVRKTGYVYRGWNGIAPGSSKLTFVLHPERDSSDASERRWEKAETMLGQPAPEWRVDPWLQAPDVPGPKRDDGRRTVLAFAWANARWDELGPQLRELERISRNGGAAPAVILSSSGHESTVRPALERHGLGTLPIGFDEYEPPTDRTGINATMNLYGRGRTPLVFVIEADGTIAHVQSGIDGLGDVLAR